MLGVRRMAPVRVRQNAIANGGAELQRTSSADDEMAATAKPSKTNWLS